MKRLNNKGMTLVEMVLGIILLAIASLMLVSGFTTSANIVNKATKIKNASAATSASIELQQAIVTDKDAEGYDETLAVTKDKNVKVQLNEFNSKNTLTTLDFEYVVKKNGTQTRKGTLSVTGSYIVGTETSTGLKYREYLASEFTFMN